MVSLLEGNQKSNGTWVRVTGDGRQIVGFARTGQQFDHEGFLWTHENGVEWFGDLTTDLLGVTSWSWDISSDGDTVLGETGVSHGEERRGFLWDLEEGSFIDLGPGVKPTSVSTNGQQAVGYADNDDGQFFWQFDRNTAPQQVRWSGADIKPVISTDGTTAIAGANNRPMRWTNRDGLHEIQGWPVSSSRWLTAISSDGSLLFGRPHLTECPDACSSFVWHESLGPRDLAEVLADHGLAAELSDWANVSVNAISDDLKTLVGHRTRLAGKSQVREAYVIYLDRPLVVSSELPGDFNGNATLDAEDLNLFAAEIRSDRNVELFDIDSDGFVTLDDQRIWVRDLYLTYFGDANLDGEFNSRDLVAIFTAGQYEDDILGNSTWGTGDWNADGEFTTSDLTLAFQDGGFELGPRTESAVPEPSAVFLLIIGFVAVIHRRKNAPVA